MSTPIGGQLLLLPGAFLHFNNSRKMKNLIQLSALFLVVLGLGMSSCKKEEEPEPELTETERLLTTKKWKFERTISYGSFDIDTDAPTATSDTSEFTRANRYMDFDLDGNAPWKDLAADTVTVEYRYTLNDDQSEMRLWEPASVISPVFYIDLDMVITALDENQLIIKGDSKRRMTEAEFPTYTIQQFEFSAI